jgi:hypothetical protein
MYVEEERKPTGQGFESNGHHQEVVSGRELKARDSLVLFLCIMVRFMGWVSHITFCLLQNMSRSWNQMYTSVIAI